MNDNAVRNARWHFHPSIRRRVTPALGLEMLELMDIDIDQDPRAFARFLELKNAAQR